MPIEHVSRTVAIDDLSVIVWAWRYVCDGCGRRDMFHDAPMPAEVSEFEPSRRGWKMHWDADDNEIASCPNCCTRAHRPQDGERT